MAEKPAFGWPVFPKPEYVNKQVKEMREQGYGFKITHLDTGSNSLLYPHHPGETFEESEAFEIRIIYWEE